MSEGEREKQWRGRKRKKGPNKTFLKEFGRQDQQSLAESDKGSWLEEWPDQEKETTKKAVGASRLKIKGLASPTSKDSASSGESSDLSDSDSEADKSYRSIVDRRPTRYK